MVPERIVIWLGRSVRLVIPTVHSRRKVSTLLIEQHLGRADQHSPRGLKTESGAFVFVVHSFRLSVRARLLERWNEIGMIAQVVKNRHLSE